MPKQDGTGTGWVYVRRKKTKPGEPGRWKQDKKMEAVTTYLATGNLRLTGSMINVPYDTMNHWKRSDWWGEMVSSIQEEENIQLDKKLEKVIAKSLDAVNDRLENGEYFWDTKNDCMRRMPAKLKDVHLVTKDIIDRKALLKKANQKVANTQRKETTDDRLLKLAETFATLALGAKPKEEKVVSEVIEGDFESLPDETKDTLNAIYEERKAGLQEGVSMGAQEEAQSGEGSSHAELS